MLVALWRPFEKTLTPFVHNLNIKTSLIESFATLYFLSAMKVQSVSLDLLIPIRLYYTNSTMSDKQYLYLAGDVEFFGEQHLPYALLALFFLTLFTLLPGMLFFLYPYPFFRKFLSRIHCDSIALKTFMDVFQGNYKDRTNNTRDYRFLFRSFLHHAICDFGEFYFAQFLLFSHGAWFYCGYARFQHCNTPSSDHKTPLHT